MILQRFFQEYKKSLSDPDLWLDCLSTWHLSVGAILAFDQLFRFHAELGEILLFPAFLVVLLAVLTRKGWLLPTLVLGSAACISRCCRPRESWRAGWNTCSVF